MIPQWGGKDKIITFHIHYLTEVIGPRGSTRPEERQAAEYVQEVLRHLGIEDVRVEAFESAAST
jgi:acetylornithine deacetylase/succinyl-diaminopimelate desuccinylase-like protein